MASRGAGERLLVRPGARYACSGAGLCCTDLHALGPLYPADLVRLRRARDDAFEEHARLHRTTLRVGADGACLFLGADGCALHVTHDKPWLCRRFPFGAVKTPAGTRVTTAHRCPCRTLGDRPLLDPGEAAASLRDEQGRIAAVATVGDRLAITGRTSLSFARYVEIEAAWIEQLLAGAAPADVLSAEPGWPEIEGLSWHDLARLLRSADAVGTSFDHALAWMGWAFLALMGLEGEPPARPWAARFDAAEARSRTARPAAEVMGDFLADLVWDLRWAAASTFDGLATDLLLRHAAAERIAAALGARGLRPERAAAEAVMIVEVAGESTPLRDALARSRPLPVRLPGSGRAPAPRRR